MFVRLVLSAWKALQSAATVTGHEVSGSTRTARCAWKALQSEAMVTGHEVLGKKRRGRCAWNFRASERRAELVRAMPSAAENLKEEALRL